MSFKISYGRQSIDNSDIKVVSKVLKSEFLTTGPKVIKFEKNFAKIVNSKYSVSCSNGTSATHLSFLAINLKKNDKIIMPTINFVASANMAKLLNAKIFLADVDPLTGQVTKNTIEYCIKKNKIRNLKAILVMHHGGHPNLGQDLLYLKKKYNCYIIEDACHSLGGMYSKKNRLKVGSCKYSDISIFSFHPVKTITTGEGGMITTNNKKIFEQIKLYRNHGIVRQKIKNTNLFLGYKITVVGFNYRLSDLNSCLGINQLKKIKKFIRIRNLIAKNYFKELSGLKNFITLPMIINNDVLSAWHLYILKINFDKLTINRSDIYKILYRKRIVTQIHYYPIYNHPIFKNLKRNYFKGTEEYFNSCLTLPIYPDLKNKEIKYICDTVKQIIFKYKK